jgi:hypothetical protein
MYCTQNSEKLNAGLGAPILENLSPDSKLNARSLIREQIPDLENVKRLGPTGPEQLVRLPTLGCFKPPL